MKYLILIAMLFIVGCGDGKVTKSTSAKLWDNINHFEFKGHEYISFRADYKAGVVHDPDCKCFKKEIK
jgi:hypothetical protein